MTGDPLSILFEPVAIGGLTIPNRIVMAPMTREFSPAGIPGRDVVEYYRRRAEGGAGLIVTEGMAVNEAGAHDGEIPLLFKEEAVRASARIAQAVHAHGALVMPQLWHVGIQDSPSEVNPLTIKKRPPRVGPSGLAGNGLPRGEALDEQGIVATIEDFARATMAARGAGFDGVEIHGAHGYLPDQFLWSRTNRRTDRYGGDAGARTRFLVELIGACRKAGGDDFPILLRISQWKSSDYAARLADTPEELEAILGPLADAGVDAFHCSARRFWEPGLPGFERTWAGWVRKLTGKPTIAVGSVTLATEFKSGTSEATGGIAESSAHPNNLSEVARLMEEGEFDMIAVGRAMIANPNWATLVRHGRADELQPYSRSALATLC
jgi:2,4-dienoyl-CoA reductase-like NADH-dependent reductase (Old Yellow Enzyme family)